MKQKVSAPVAIAAVVIVLVILFGVLYKRYLYQPTYSVADIAAKYRAAAAKMHAPNAATNAQPQQPNGSQ